MAELELKWTSDQAWTRGLLVHHTMWKFAWQLDGILEIRETVKTDRI